MWRGRGSGGGGGGGMYSNKKKPGSGSLGSVPPPAYLTMSNAAGKRAIDETAKKKEEQYAALMYGHTSGASSSGSKSSSRQKRLYDDEYLERDDDDDEDGGTDDGAYQPAPGSPTGSQSKSTSGDQDEEDDPLDAFMADINQQAKKDKEASEKHELDKEKEKAEKDDKKKLGRTDIDEEDMQESYFRFLEEQKAAAGDDDEIFEYDEDGNVIWTWKKIIDPLPPIDHAGVDYTPFDRCFYTEHSDISALNHLQTEQLRQTLNIKASGLNVPKPVTSFAHFGFDEQLMSIIRKSEYTQPTSIQAQAIPAILSGRDVIGIAKTGSGKTAAYLWPALVHIMHQSELQPGDGPIALIVVPTRELAIQVYQEAKRFGKVYNINVVCAYGGGSKWEQQNALAEGAEIVVATPGRIIDMVKMGATNFTRVTYLVFDEADRMFDMGFELQVRSVADHVRPDRQCLMFSATFKKRVERLAREQLNDAIRIVQGEIGEANEDIKQTVEVFATPPDKWTWLMDRLVKFSTIGKVLIFVTRKQNSEELATNLKTRDMPVCLLHGDMQQHERNETISAFRKEVPILVATDVAARGLDIPEIRTVINFDVARDIDTHVHRIGRTGRAGEKGEAFTLVTEKDKEFAGHLVRNLESVNQPVPEKLMQLAMQAAWFRKSRHVDGAAGPSSGSTRMGLGFKPRTRAGFGAAQTSSTPSASSAFLSGGSGSSGSGGGRSLQDAFSKAQSSGGPTNRIASLKAAFSTSYKNTFQSASSNELPGRTPVTDPTPEWKKQMEQVNASLQSSGSIADKKKRSRWE